MPSARRRLIALLLAFSLLGLTTTGMAQTRTIPYQVACANCRVVIESVVTLGSPTDSILLDQNTSVAQDSRGNYYATAFGRQGLVIFDANGRYVRAFGRQGQGPGEFASAIRAFTFRNDSLYVINSRQKIMVFSPTLAFVRDATFPPFYGSGPPATSATLNGFIMPGSMRGGGAGGPGDFRYHLVSFDSAAVRSFGDASANPPVPTPYFGVLSPDASYLWAVDADYLLARWQVATGAVQLLQVTNVPWLRRAPPTTPDEMRADMLAQLQARQAGREPPPTSRTPSSAISAMRVDDQDRVWLWTSAHFNDDRRPAGPLSSCRGTEIKRNTGGWRTCLLLEVIDTRRGVLLVSQLTDATARFIPNTDLMYNGVQDANGVTSIRIVRARLIGS